MTLANARGPLEHFDHAIPHSGQERWILAGLERAVLANGET